MFSSSKSRVRRGVSCLAAVVLVVLAVACRPIPETGLYSTQQYTDTELISHTGLTYGTAVNVSGQTVSLRLDLYLPPASAPRPLPLVIAIHGGGFVGGDRTQMATAARSYARRGFAAATISYRLRPNLSSTDQAGLFAAALDGMDDGMESVRWLRANAATYGIDTTRIGMVGSSAGGVVAMGTAVHDDPTPGGPLASVSPKINAAVSTGVNLTPGFELGVIQSQPTDAPIMMFHYDTDTVTGQTFAYANQSCDTINAAKAVCRIVRNPGTGHTVSMSAGATFWVDQFGPFLWNHLRLHADQGGHTL
jgi:dienelactone hydrolase